MLSAENTLYTIITHEINSTPDYNFKQTNRRTDEQRNRLTE
jgi:hypothetical protein